MKTLCHIFLRWPSKHGSIRCIDVGPWYWCPPEDILHESTQEEAAVTHFPPDIVATVQGYCDSQKESTGSHL